MYGIAVPPATWRRLRACRELGLPTISARILDMEGNRDKILRTEPISVMRHNGQI